MQRLQQSHTQCTDPSAFSAHCTTQAAALCVLQVYNGVGGPDEHRALAAPPFQWCAYGTAHGAPAYAADCEPRNPLDVSYPATTLPSTSTADFVLAGGAGVVPGQPEDDRCGGTNFRARPGATVRACPVRVRCAARH